MIDFSGWASNWEWDGHSYSEIPSWAPYALIVPAIVGAVCMLLSFTGSGIGVLWTIGALLASLGIELFARDGLDEDDRRLLLLSYQVSTIFGGLFALIALRTSGTDFAVVASSVVFAFSPITSRALGATSFSLRMVQYAKNQGELVKKTLAGEIDALVVRVDGVDGSDAKLVTIGEASGSALVATWQALGLNRTTSVGCHFLLEAPTLGDTEASGYRGESPRRRVVATKKSRYLGLRPASCPPGSYWDEVRAGIVFVLLEQSILFGAAWLIVHAIR